MSKKAICFFLILLLACILFSLLFGKYGFGVAEYWSYFKAVFLKTIGVNNNFDNNGFTVINTIITEVRLPRIAACIIIGASLGISGGAYQAMFVNPLVSPSILGVLNGASFGAALGMILGLSQVFIQISTLFFGLLAVIISIGICIFYSRMSSVLLLVLGGIISASLFSALLSVIKYSADPNDTLPRITYFLLGSLSFATKNSIEIAFVPMLAGIIILCFCARSLNALSLGEEEARTLGVNVFRIKIIVIFCATLISALSVTIAGIIGWIGLIVPHISRFVFGANNQIVLLSSAIIGAIFLLFCDTFSRIIFSYEVPIGVITSLFGIPVFIAVLSKANRRF